MQILDTIEYEEQIFWRECVIVQARVRQRSPIAFRDSPAIFSSSWVRCTINRSLSTPCKKAEFEHLQFFSRHCLDFISACEWQDLSFTYQKSEKTSYLDNLVFSAFSVL